MSQFSGRTPGANNSVTLETDGDDEIRGDLTDDHFTLVLEEQTDQQVATPQVPDSKSKKRKLDEANSEPTTLDTLTQSGTGTLVLFMDIGMGDCTIVVPPKGGKALLIDAGWTTPPELQGKRVDGAQYAKHLAYLIHHLGVTRLRIVLTHGDRDHHSVFEDLRSELQCVTTITRVYSPEHKKAKDEADKFRPKAPYEHDKDQFSDDSEREEEEPKEDEAQHTKKKLRKDDEAQESTKKKTGRLPLSEPTKPEDSFDEGYKEWVKNNPFYADMARPRGSPSAKGAFKRKIFFETSQVERSVWGLRAHWLAADVMEGTKIGSERDNAVSLCMELLYGDASVVLMGDAIGVTQKEAQKCLVNARSQLTTVLKLSHHGSDTNKSNEESWITAVDPRCVIASGAACTHGLPKSDIIHRTDSLVWPAPKHPLTSFRRDVPKDQRRWDEECTRAQFATLSTGTLAARLTLKGTKTKIDLKWERGEGKDAWQELKQGSPAVTTPPPPPPKTDEDPMITT